MSKTEQAYNTTYAVRASAVRGAKRAGIEDAVIAKNEETGQFYIVRPGAVFVPEQHEGKAPTELPTVAKQLAVAAAVATGVSAEKFETVAPILAKEVPAVADTHMVGGPVVTPVAKDATVKPVKFGYKDIARKSPATSQVQSPLDVIWDILNSTEFPSRKAAIAHLVSVGININTARTQYQHWKASDGVRPVKAKAAPVILD